MLPSQFAIERKVISWMLILILTVGGGFAFLRLGMLEDPPFTIKEAQVLVAYPGASAPQVEQEVTSQVEDAVQQLAALDKVTSVSSPGRAQIQVSIQKHFAGLELQQMWDELRRKIGDMASSLPPGASQPLVYDDFGDVYGILFAVTGDGFSYRDLRDYVDHIRRELVLVEGVAKVEITGAREEQVFVEILQTRMANLGISIQRIYDLLQTQNVVSNAGRILAGTESVRIHPTGEFSDVSELERLLISEPGAPQLVYLGDVATISRGYAEVPQRIMRFNSDEALVVGISFAAGVNVVDVGGRVLRQLIDLKYALPVGIELHEIYNQPAEVAKSVTSFMLNLGAAVAIVIGVLLLFMGLKSGVLIGLILLMTCTGTFIFMAWMGIELQRISLGALIIALGMLVDNAIVVTDGVLIGLKRGLTRLQAANAIVRQTMWPLLGATVIAVIAFAPIGLSQDATGEFAGSLFYVLLISLMLSWLTAITITPFLCHLLFREEVASGEASKDEDRDPYRGVVFTVYRSLLDVCMRYRTLTMLVLMVGLVVSVYAFGQVKRVFFPPSTTPILLVDYWLPQGTDIRATDANVAAIQRWLREQEHVQFVTATVGAGLPRFMLTYTPEKAYESYTQLMVRVDDFKHVVPTMKRVRDHLAEYHPQASIKFRRLEIGPSPAARIEARFMGPDPNVLRRLAAEAKAVIASDPGTTNIRDDWRERSKMIRPQFSEAAARRLGISKQDMDQALMMSFSGMAVGLYRDGTQLLPILVRLPEAERLSVDTIRDVQLWSSIHSRYVPIGEVVSEFRTEWEDAIIQRRDRKRTLTVLTDQDIFGDETADDLLRRIRPMVEAIRLPDGYALEWGGEYESSRNAQAALFSSLPLGYLAMFLITVLLFNAVRAPLVIWACVPLAIIGISIGLLVTQKPFGFMALLGMLSLTGMLIKNGIVLVDQINSELAAGAEPYRAVFESGVSRVRPVAMAAITTILGMLPLLRDAFFESMAVTIMFGLGFATLLTLLAVPVLYTLFYGIAYRPLQEIARAG